MNLKTGIVPVEFFHADKRFEEIHREKKECLILISQSGKNHQYGR